MSKYSVQRQPYIVPTTDDKLIREHFGFLSIYANDMSLAHMTAPPGWSEPAQVAQFDEYTFVISGRKSIEIDGEEIVIGPSQSICVYKGTKVRYSNPFDEPTDYVSVCIPGFNLERVEREQNIA